MGQCVYGELSEGLLGFSKFDIAEEEFVEGGRGVMVVKREGFGKEMEFGFEGFEMEF